MNPLRILGVIWALPWTLVGLLLGGIGLITGGKAQRRGPVLEFYGGLIKATLTRLPLGSVAAMTMGHVILGRDAAGLDWCRVHEMVHVRQYERWGPFFVPAYLAASGWAWVRRRDPYRDNPFEIEARRIAGR